MIGIVYMDVHEGRKWIIKEVTGIIITRDGKERKAEMLIEFQCNENNNIM